VSRYDSGCGFVFTEWPLPIPTRVAGDITDKQSLESVVDKISGQAAEGIHLLYVLTVVNIRRLIDTVPFSVNNAGVAGEASREGYEDLDKTKPEAISKQLWKSDVGE
jgi:hypothetical protein